MEGSVMTRMASIRSSLDNNSDDPLYERVRQSLNKGVPVERTNSHPANYLVRTSSVSVAPDAKRKDLGQLSRSYSVQFERSGDETPTAELVGKDDGEEIERDGGQLYSWGRISLMLDGEGGDTPRRVERFETRKIRACSTSGWHALCCDDEGNVFGAGSNAFGEAVPGAEEEEVERPQRIEAFAVGVRVALVACGVGFSAVVVSSGQVLAWGSNDFGQCGLDPKSAAVVRAPTLVRGLARKVAQIVAGDSFVAAKNDALEVYVWGNAEACCCLEEEATHCSAPKRIEALAGVPVTNLAAGAFHAVALAASGRAYAWGRNSRSQCGIPDAGDLVRVPTLVAISQKVEIVAAGRSHSVFVVRNDGVYGVGRDHAGQISGNPTTQDFQEIVPLPISTREKAAVVAAAAGDSHTLLALDDGRILAIGGKSSTTRTMEGFPAGMRFKSIEAAGEASFAIVCRSSSEVEETTTKKVPFGRQDSLVVVGKLTQRPIEAGEAGLVGAAAAAGDKERLAAIFANPNLLSASFLDGKSLDRRALDSCLKPLSVDDDIMAQAVADGAKKMCAIAESAASPDAARVVLCYLRIAATFLSDDNAYIPRRAAFLAARFAVQLFLSVHEDCRAGVLSELLPMDGGEGREFSGDTSDDGAYRALVRRPLKALVVVAALRCAIDGRIPSGDGVDLKECVALLTELEETVKRNREERDASENENGQSLEDFERSEHASSTAQETLEAPAALAKRALRARDGGLFAKDSAVETFAAGHSGVVGLDLLRSASRHRVPRAELSSSSAYRVPEIDALGVLFATKVEEVGQMNENALSVAAGPGALLKDFMRWRDSGAPTGQESRPSCWHFSSFMFLCSAETKRELCAVEARRRQGFAGFRAQMLRAAAPASEAFASLGFPVAGSLATAAASEPFLILRVSRDRTMFDARSLLHLPDSEFSKELKVVFEGEEGIDAGGVRKEFFSLLVPQLFDPVVGMFVEAADGTMVFFNPLCDWYDTEYELAGILVGLAVYNQVVLDIHLPRVAYKKLLLEEQQRQRDKCGKQNTGDDDEDDEAYTLDDLAELDAELVSGLRQLLTYEPASDVDSIFCRSFVDDRDGDLVDLVPNGSSVPVTGINRKEYVNALLEYRLVAAVEPQFTRFARGFSRVMSSARLDKLVEPEELKVMVQGEQCLDFHALQEAATYEGYHQHHPIVEELWRVVHSLDAADQRKFLMFVTANKTAPLGGLAKLRPSIKIQRMCGDSNQLPTAHTCFNSLLIPDYSPPSKLESLLHRSINECEGFGLM